MAHLGTINFMNLHSVPSSGSHATVAAVARYNAQLKDSYKFHHSVLASSGPGAGAAIGVDKGSAAAAAGAPGGTPCSQIGAAGLGCVCAEKTHLEAARSVFGALRESEMTRERSLALAISACNAASSSASSPGTSAVHSSTATAGEDVAANLGHVHMAAGRHLEAATMYALALRAVHIFGAPATATAAAAAAAGPKRGLAREAAVAVAVNHVHPSAASAINAIVSLSECLACAQLKCNQFAEASTVLCRSLHWDPSAQQTLYNLACMAEEEGFSAVLKRSASGKMKNRDGSATATAQSPATTRELELAIHCFGSAYHYYSHLVAAQQAADAVPGSGPPLTSYSTPFLRHAFTGAHSRRLALEIKAVESHATTCRDNKVIAEQLLKSVRASEERRRAALEALEGEAQRARRERAAAAEASQAAEAETQRQRQEQAAARAAHLEKLQEDWAGRSSTREHGQGQGQGQGLDGVDGADPTAGVFDGVSEEESDFGSSGSESEAGAGADRLERKAAKRARRDAAGSGSGSGSGSGKRRRLGLEREEGQGQGQGQEDQEEEAAGPDSGSVEQAGAGSGSGSGSGRLSRKQVVEDDEEMEF